MVVASEAFATQNRSFHMSDRVDEAQLKRLGALHGWTATFFLLLGSALALFGQLATMVPRVERWSSALMSLHGLIMVFLCWAPGLSFSLAPLQRPTLHGAPAIKARWFSYVLYVAGATTIVISAIAGGSRYGFRYYLCYFDRVHWATLGVTWGVALVALAMGVNGMLWLGYEKQAERAKCSTPFTTLLGVTGGVHVLVAPLALSLALAISIEHRWKIGIFEPSLGGDPGLLPSLFWLYCQPILMASALPVMGLIAETLARSSPDSSASPSIVVSRSQAVAIATLCFLTWGTRAEVPFSEVTRNFFAFTGLSMLLVLGRPIVSAIAALGRAIPRSASTLSASALLLALAFGVL